MTDTIVRLDLVHEAHFGRPAFELLREAPAVIANFYDELSPNFTVNAEHITAAYTNVLSEVLVRIGLFNNVAAVEIRPQRMSVRLPNISNTESVAIATNAIRATHSALAKGPPKIDVVSTSFLAHCWVALEGGEDSARRLLARNSIPVAAIDPVMWNGDEIKYGLRFTSRNVAEGWTVTVFGEASLVPGSHLFLAIELVMTSRSDPIDDHIRFAEEKLRQVLVGLGLNVAPELVADG